MIDEDPANTANRAAILDGLRRLRRFTPARIALGRAGPAQPTEASLRFMLDHARARDAVHAVVDFNRIKRAAKARGWSALRVHSAARDRAAYLRRPDLGRRLSADGRRAIEQSGGTRDVAIVAADGLSALAINTGLLPLLDCLRPLLLERGFAVGPLTLVEQGRVAIGDEVGGLMHAKLTVVLIGERPGLSAADSLGAYITWRAHVGSMDSERNCVSNIRLAGLSFPIAATQIADLIGLAFAHHVTGVRLNALQHVRAALIPERDT
jgi:ethanolamine ammonia-lyase small subunit